MGNHRKQTFRCPVISKISKFLQTNKSFDESSEKILKISWLGVGSNHWHIGVQPIALP
jgi:hypothetical protein